MPRHEAAGEGQDEESKGVAASKKGRRPYARAVDFEDHKRPASCFVDARKLWFIPVVIILLSLGIIILGETTALGPLIYTLFKDTVFRMTSSASGEQLSKKNLQYQPRR